MLISRDDNALCCVEGIDGDARNDSWKDSLDGVLFEGYVMRFCLQRITASEYADSFLPSAKC